MADDTPDFIPYKGPAPKAAGGTPDFIPYQGAAPSRVSASAPTGIAEPSLMKQAPLPTGLQPTERTTLASGSYGVPISMDVPKGYGQAVQQGQQQALSTGAKIGIAAEGLLTAPVATALGYGGSELAGYGAEKAGLGPVGQTAARIGGGLVGGVSGGLLQSKFGSIASRVLRDPESGNITLSPSAIAERVVPQRPEILAKQQAAAREELLNQKAQSLMDRQAQQDKLDADFASRLKEAGASRQKELADIERLKEQHARSLMQRGAAQAKLDAASEGNATGPEGAAPESSGAADIISRNQKVVLPGSSIPATPQNIKIANDYTQVEASKLQVLAKLKDPFAILELASRRKKGLL